MYNRKVSEHIPSCFSMPKVLSFKSTEKKNDVRRDSMKKFCKSFRQSAMKMINFKKKKNEVINKRAAGII